MPAVISNPYNLVCSNITSMYGGMITKDSWKASGQRKLKVNNKKKRNADWTSCDETAADSLVQAYDDEKLELLCYEHWYNIMFFRQSQFGQARSPFKVELNSEQEDPEGDVQNNSIAIAVDGENYFIRGSKSIDVKLDPGLPKIRVARRIPKLADISQVMKDLYHLAPPFV